MGLQSPLMRFVCSGLFDSQNCLKALWDASEAQERAFYGE
jgi:hypothetical protein